MKRFTKLLGIVLMVALVMSISVSAFAATITINQPTPSDGTAGAETYTAYKIFDVTKNADAATEPTTTNTTIENQTTHGVVGGDAGYAEGYSYTIDADSAWVAVLQNSAQTWVTLTLSADGDVYNITPNASFSGASAAADFADYLLANVPATLASVDKSYPMTSNGTTATATVDDGYYLIKSSLGTNLVLATSNITINTKNEYVTDQKSVEESNYNVGDHVPYTITVNLPASIDYTKPVIVHDTMDNVLKLDTDSVAAKVGTDTFSDITLVTSDNFSTFYVDPKAAHNDTDHAAAEGKVIYDFYLDISSLAPAANTEPTAKTITITYTAELLSTALADTGYINKEFIEYSKYKTAPNDVTVKTYDFDLSKIFTGAESDTTLKAKFTLYDQAVSYVEDEAGTLYQLTDGTYTDVAPTTETTADYASTTKYKMETGAGSTGIQLITDTTVSGKTCYVRPDFDDTATKTTDIEVVQGTVTNVRGLKAGTYYLVETETSSGYNLLTGPVVITISDEGTVTITGSGALNSSGEIEITNNSGTVLPSTGGIGTTIFYVVGSILVVAAGVLLVTKKRMGRD